MAKPCTSAVYHDTLDVMDLGDLPADKTSARARIRAARRADVAGDGGLGRRALVAEQLRDALLIHLSGRRPGTITAYESWATEPPTEALIAGLRDAGWHVIVPETLPDMDLSWHVIDEPDADLGQAGIATADVVLVPALAVDQDGYRLGQGGGCYDRALLRRRAGAPVIATVFDHEVVRRVPREQHDQQVDAVLTPDGLRSRDATTGRIRLQGQ